VNLTQKAEERNLKNVDRMHVFLSSYLSRKYLLDLAVAILIFVVFVWF
jgi:ABC-type transport system involved in cytochrome bd biosynthesis fused ATPase/permease subunit